MTDTRSATTPADLVGTWTIDRSHSTVGFSVRHMMVSKVRGHFSEYEGEIQIGEDSSQSSVRATVQMGSISTNDEQRDAHLRSADFFDTDVHPTMTFESTGISGFGSDYELTGDLTIRGITHPVTFDLEVNGTGTNPWGATVVGFTATASIDRADYGLTWNQALETGGILVGDKVKIELEIEATKAD